MKTPVTLFALIIISAAIICIMFSLAVRPVTYSRGFTRRVSDSAIVMVNSLDLPSDSYYIAGLTDEQVYIGNTSDPSRMSVTDFNLAEISSFSITLEDHNISSGATVEIDSPYFFIKNGPLGLIAKGEMGKWKVSRQINNVPGFEQAAAAGSNSFVVHSLVGDETEIRNMLLRTPSALTYPIETMGGNFYDADGILRINKKRNLLVYTYMYCNSYLVMDTSLNLIHKGNTLDTITRPRIKMAKMADGSYTLASPPSRVNQNTFISDTRLFVHSNLMGTDEQKRSFDQSSVIDIYDLVDNKYLFSFYVPDYKSNKVSSFHVLGKKIIAIQGNAIVSYTYS